MAAKKDFNSIIADIRAGRFAPIYLLSGEESYYLDCITEALRKYVVSEEDADFNVDIFYGADSEVTDVAAAARQYPSFAPRRLVMLKESQAMQRAKQQLDGFLPYLNRPAESTVLVIVFKGESLSDKSKIAKAVIAANGIVFTSPKIRDYQLADIIKRYCKDNSIGIADKAVTMLAEHVGQDLSRLFGEIEKLKKSTPDKGRLTITPELVERNIGISKDFNNFELVSAIFKRDYAKSMRIAIYFGKNQKDNPPVVTVTTIFNSFVKLMRAHYSKDRSASGIRSKFGLYGSSAIDEFMVAMRNYPPGRCFRIIHALRRFDCEIKGSGSMQPVEELLRELIYKIFTL